MVFCKDIKIYLHWLGSESRQVTSDITVRFPLTHNSTVLSYFLFIFVILKKGATSFPRKGREWESGSFSQKKSNVARFLFLKWKVPPPPCKIFQLRLLSSILEIYIQTIVNCNDKNVEFSFAFLLVKIWICASKLGS